MVNTPSVMIFYLSGGPDGTLEPRFLWALAEFRESIQFTSSRWFLAFWEANESSECVSQKCTDICAYCLAHSSRRFFYYWKPVPGSLDQYLDINDGSFSAVAMEQWAKRIYPGERVLRKYLLH